MTTEQPPEAGPLYRLHPLTPVLRGFKYFTAVVAVISVREMGELGVRRTLEFLPVVVVAGFVLAYLSWRFTWYRIEGRELHVESGVLFRRSRRVPLERVQAVDIVRPLIGRALGLAELRLEVVGQGATEAPLAYLKDEEAQRLRDRLLALAAGVDENAPAPEETVLARVPTRDLVVSVLLLGQVVVGLPLLVIVSVALLLINVPAFLGALPALGPVAFGIFRTTVQRVLVEYGFTLATSADGLRLRHGLLETRLQTVPPGRVQALRLVQPVLWRRRDWARLEIDVAGYGGGDDEQLATRALLPVAPRAICEHLVDLVLGGSDITKLPRRPVPRRAAWCDPVQWRQLGLAVTPQVLVVSRGRLRRILDVVPLAKVQSIRVVQGPLQRWQRLASVHMDTAGRHLSTEAAHRDRAEIRGLVEELSDMSRAERERRRRPAMGQ
ncbi:MAG: PH domain-containing protein [Actinomycetota bacterium]|nr:PH domain-containing protein [Actinomycetota bacterium]